jgi:hypothetical protein
VSNTNTEFSFFLPNIWSDNIMTFCASTTMRTGTCDELMGNDDDTEFLTQADDQAMQAKFHVHGYHHAYDNDDDNAAAGSSSKGSDNIHQTGFSHGYRSSFDVSYRIGMALGQAMMQHIIGNDCALADGQGADDAVCACRTNQANTTPIVLPLMAHTIHKSLANLPTSSDLNFDSLTDTKMSHVINNAHDDSKDDAFLSLLENQIQQLIDHEKNHGSETQQFFDLQVKCCAKF